MMKMTRMTARMVKMTKMTQPVSSCFYSSLSLPLILLCHSLLLQHCKVQSIEPLCKFTDWQILKVKVASSSLFTLDFMVPASISHFFALSIHKSKKHALYNRIRWTDATFNTMNTTTFSPAEVVQSPWTLCCKSLRWTLMNGTIGTLIQ